VFPVPLTAQRCLLFAASVEKRKRKRPTLSQALDPDMATGGQVGDCHTGYSPGIGGSEGLAQVLVMVGVEETAGRE